MNDVSVRCKCGRQIAVKTSDFRVASGKIEIKCKRCREINALDKPDELDYTFFKKALIIK